MCRLFAVTSQDPISPMVAIRALNVMKEGHDGSGVGLFLSDLGGDFQLFRKNPILSGIFSNEGINALDRFMMDLDFMVKYKLSIRPARQTPAGTPKRDNYLIRVYEYPTEWESLSETEIQYRLLMTRLKLREIGEKDGSMLVFSFWPDVIMIKEVGDPMAIAEYLGLDRPELDARIIMAQGRQNTNYAIDIYACHPFFIQGIATMTNGENTAFVPIREFLMSRGCTGYVGYQSDSEVFTHILHYATNQLGLGLDMYKHIITPLEGRGTGPSPGRQVAPSVEAELPAPDHRRAELCHGLSSGQDPVHGPGQQEAAARCRRRRRGPVCLLLRDVRSRCGHSVPEPASRFPAHEVRHGLRAAGPPGG